MALKLFRASPLPSPPPDYDPQYGRQLIRVLELYFSQLDSRTPNFAESYEADSFIGGTFTGTFVGPVTYAYTSKTANYTATADDCIIDCTANAFTVSLPTAVGIAGKAYTVKNSGSGVITVDPDGAETIDGSATQTLTSGAYGGWGSPINSITIVSTGANWIVVGFA